MGSRGIVTGAVLPARSSAHVPPAWMWFMCSMPGSGSPRIWSVTSTPPLTSWRVAVPLTPESRLGVSWTPIPPASSFAKALPPTTRAANNVMPKAKQADRVAWCTVFPLRYLLQAAAVLTWEAVLSIEPKAKRSASSYLNISWVQHIDILLTAQDVSSRGGGYVGRERRRTSTPEVRRTRCCLGPIGGRGHLWCRTWA